MQADLNGDGEPEIIVATHDAKLQVRSLATCLSSQLHRLFHQSSDHTLLTVFPQWLNRVVSFLRLHSQETFGRSRGDWRINHCDGFADRLQVIAPRPPGRPGDGFAPSKVLLEVDLAQLSSQNGVSASAAVIAAGTLDTPAKELVRSFRKQVRNTAQVALARPLDPNACLPVTDHLTHSSYKSLLSELFDKRVAMNARVRRLNKSHMTASSRRS